MAMRSGKYTERRKRMKSRKKERQKETCEDLDKREYKWGRLQRQSVCLCVRVCVYVQGRALLLPWWVCSVSSRSMVAVPSSSFLSVWQLHSFRSSRLWGVTLLRGAKKDKTPVRESYCENGHIHIVS